MKDFQQILTFASPLLGTMSAQQSMLFSLVVNAVQEEIGARLMKDADPAQYEDSVTLATVLLAVTVMRQLKDADISDFTAGTLKISLRDDHSAYVQMANRLLAPWCADGVAFRGVSA